MASWSSSLPHYWCGALGTIIYHFGTEAPQPFVHQLPSLVSMVAILALVASRCCKSATGDAQFCDCGLSPFNWSLSKPAASSFGSKLCGEEEVVGNGTATAAHRSISCCNSAGALHLHSWQWSIVMLELGQHVLWGLRCMQWCPCLRGPDQPLYSGRFCPVRMF